MFMHYTNLVQQSDLLATYIYGSYQLGQFTNLTYNLFYRIFGIIGEKDENLENIFLFSLY